MGKTISEQEAEALGLRPPSQRKTISAEEGARLGLRVSAPRTPRPDWMDEGVPVAEDRSRVSAGEAAMLGAGDTITRGHGDELSGALDAIGGAARRAGQASGLVDPEPVAEYERPQPTTYTIRDHRQPAVASAGRQTGATPDVMAVRVENQPNLPTREEPRPASVLDDYREGRDAHRRYDQRAFDDQTAAYMGGAIGADIPIQALLATATGGASLTPQAQAAIGAVHGFGSSEADLTRPSVGNVANAVGSSALGAGMGYGVTRVAQGLGSAWQNSGARKAISGYLDKAISDALDLVQKKADKALRSGVSAVGGETSSAKRTLEVLEEILTNPGATPEEKVAAKALLESPEGVALLRGVYENTLERAPSQLGRIEAARAALPALRDAASPEAVASGAQELLAKPMDPVKRFAINYSSRVIPPLVGSYVGNELGDGGLTGTLIGTGVGAGVGAALGNPGTALKNLMKNPSVRRAWWSALQGAPDAAFASLGKYGPVLSRALQTGGLHDVIAIDEALSDEDDDYRNLKAKALGISAPSQPATE